MYYKHPISREERGCSSLCLSWATRTRALRFIPAICLQLLAVAGYRLFIGQGGGHGGADSTRGAAHAKLTAMGMVPVESTRAHGKQTAYEIPEAAFVCLDLGFDFDNFLGGVPLRE